MLTSRAQRILGSKNMEQMLSLVVTAILLFEANAQPINKTACTASNSTTATLPLQCPDGHVIHVQYWLTSLSHKGDISNCIADDKCNNLQDSDRTYLTTFCNGLQSCNDNVKHIRTTDCFNGTTTRYFHVQYECIPVADNSTVSLCSDVLVTANSTSLYLKTHAFPRDDNARNTTCVCEVQGQGLSVTVLELHFLDGVASLSISNGTAQLWRHEVDFIMVNKEVIGPETQDSLIISFHDHGGNGQKAWLRASATSGSLSIGCGSKVNMTTPPHMSPTTPARTAASTHTTSGTGSVDLSTSVTSQSIHPSVSSTVDTSNMMTSSDLYVNTSSDPTTFRASISDGITHFQTSSISASAISPASSTSSYISNTLLSSNEANTQNYLATDTVVKAVPASIGAIVAIIIITVIVVICRRRQSRRREDALERIPGPQGDLYTMSKKKTRSLPPSAVSLFQDSNHPSDASQSSKTSPQDCLAPPLQVHHNPAFSPDARADDKYVSTGSLAAHVYQEISDLDLDRDVVSPDRPVPEKNRGHKSTMFVSVSPTGAGSHSQEQNPYVKPKKQYWAVVADTNKENNGVENQNRTASQKYKEAQPYAVSGVFTRRKTTGAKVEVVPLKCLIFTESDATGQSNADGRSGEEIDLLSEANNERIPTKTQRQGNTNNPAVKPITKMETSASAESESARATKSEREKYDPYADYEAVDMNDINGDFPGACPGVSDDVDPATCKSDFDPYAGYQSVDFDDQGGNMMASYVSQSPEAGRKINQYEEIDCEDGMPSVRNTRNTEDCLVDNILYESSRGLGNASAMKPDRSETDSSSGMTESTEIADEESKASNGTSIVDDYGKTTPAQSKGSRDENCLVDNILYESTTHIRDPNV